MSPDDLSPFFSPGALRIMREAEAEGRAERASVVRWQAEALVSLLDQRIEDARVVNRLVRPSLSLKSLKHLKQFLLSPRHVMHQHRERRLLEKAQRRELALQKAEAIFVHPHAGFDSHFQGSASIHSNDRDATSAQPEAHRLSEETFRT